ncbi:hypothetical protein RIF25_11725 [Thermosynechococcaceae cyanobacterium BACA0444]|uniref:Uncharacterized protein n=1 Tax=Pseudocalidococcus azoricus BACA0444 TaxID=2918990 RepID=A0AAE4FV52_9CYAN|nr:hypothetical protein [Pseudocalidococcus azoricus]MDS3861475.1 hypothetical protein [Pseudocalidococcus azoricus BACA0444]
MIEPLLPVAPPASDSSQVWLSLKQAIAQSSGFKRWLQESALRVMTDADLDTQVAAYLRQTLETLAY